MLIDLSSETPKILSPPSPSKQPLKWHPSPSRQLPLRHSRTLGQPLQWHLSPSGQPFLRPLFKHFLLRWHCLGPPSLNSCQSPRLHLLGLLASAWLHRTPICKLKSPRSLFLSPYFEKKSGTPIDTSLNLENPKRLRPQGRSETIDQQDRFYYSMELLEHMLKLRGI